MAMRTALNQARPAAARELMPRFQPPRFLLRFLKPREDPKLQDCFRPEALPDWQVDNKPK